jgi:hypothetical protein
MNLSFVGRKIRDAMRVIRPARRDIQATSLRLEFLMPGRSGKLPSFSLVGIPQAPPGCKRKLMSGNTLAVYLRSSGLVSCSTKFQYLYSFDFRNPHPRRVIACSLLADWRWGMTRMERNGLSTRVWKHEPFVVTCLWSWKICRVSKCPHSAPFHLCVRFAFEYRSISEFAIFFRHPTNALSILDGHAPVVCWKPHRS